VGYTTGIYTRIGRAYLTQLAGPDHTREVELCLPEGTARFTIEQADALCVAIRSAMAGHLETTHPEA
jgi:hypothetical protein